MSKFCSGEVLVHGIGHNNGKCPASKDRKMLREYNLWTDMLLRCTNKYWVKFPTYVGTTCSENFKSYEYFYGWCQTQVGFNTKDEYGESWQLDKDLLSKGDKHYSEDTCVFISQSINSMLTRNRINREGCPQGVYLDKRRSKFFARCGYGKSKSSFLGYFDTTEQAAMAYKVFKEKYSREVAEKYKPQLDERAYKALLSYVVN